MKTKISKTNYSNILSLSFSLLLIVLFFTFNVYAGEYHVKTSERLQEVLSDAESNEQNDTIFLDAGIYYGVFAFRNPTNNAVKTLTIMPEPGLNPGQVILDGEERGSALYINAGEKVINVILEKLVFQNGGDYPNGVYIVTKGKAEVRQCTFRKNSIGISVIALDIELENNLMTECAQGIKLEGNSSVTFDRNTIINSSWGSEIISSFIYFNNNIFRGNKCGISINAYNDSILSNNIIAENKNLALSILSIVYRSKFELRNNNISNNSGANVAVNAISEASNSLIAIENNSIIGNAGGGINIDATYNYNYYVWHESDVAISNNIITNNNEGSHGGVTIHHAASCSIFNNLISKNYSSSRAGGVYISSKNLNMINNTISDNVSDSNGGGIYFDIAETNESINVYNNIIWGNQAKGSGDDIYLTGYGAVRNLYNNNIHDLVGEWDNGLDPNTNIDVAPMFIDSENDDYRLSSNSACINAGNNEASELPETDMDGNPRILDTVVDMGAFEHSSDDMHPADINNNWSIELSEFTEYGNSWKNGITWQKGPDPIPVEFVTSAGYLYKSGGAYQNNGGGKPACWIPATSR